VWREIKSVNYGFLEMISDLGGVMDLFVIIGGFFLLPYSRVSFELKLMKMLYKVRTSDS
jgi:polysaccharide pyruvyl transferase WcaK-like protein